MSTIIPLVAYTILTTFSPGPNNVTAASSGVKQGFSRTIPYLLGIGLGFFVVMLACGSLNWFLASRTALFLPIAKVVGCAYLIYLAVSPFLHKGGQKTTTGYTFFMGAVLQLVNPKVILSGLTLYSLFPSILLASSWAAIISAVALAMVGLTSVSLWCLTGGAFARVLNTPRRMLAFDLFMSGFLVLTAVSVILS